MNHEPDFWSAVAGLCAAVAAAMSVIVAAMSFNHQKIVAQKQTEFDRQQQLNRIEDRLVSIASSINTYYAKYPNQDMPFRVALNVAEAVDTACSRIDSCAKKHALTDIEEKELKCILVMHLCSDASEQLFGNKHPIFNMAEQYSYDDFDYLSCIWCRSKNRLILSQL